MDTVEDPGTGQPPVDAPEQEPAQDADDAETRGEPDVEPSEPEPADADASDPHTGPLDDDEDARHLARDDPRRLEAEERRGRAFDDDEPQADADQEQGEEQQAPDES